MKTNKISIQTLRWYYAFSFWHSYLNSWFERTCFKYFWVINIYYFSYLNSLFKYFSTNVAGVNWSRPVEYQLKRHIRTALSGSLKQNQDASGGNGPTMGQAQSARSRRYVGSSFRRIGLALDISLEVQGVIANGTLIIANSNRSLESNIETVKIGLQNAKCHVAMKTTLNLIDKLFLLRQLGEITRRKEFLFKIQGHETNS